MKTTRFAKRRAHVLAKLSTLQARPDFASVSDFVHQVLNLAAFRSEAGREGEARDLLTKLLRAIKKLSSGSGHRSLTDALDALE